MKHYERKMTDIYALGQMIMKINEKAGIANKPSLSKLINTNPLLRTTITEVKKIFEAGNL